MAEVAALRSARAPRSFPHGPFSAADTSSSSSPAGAPAACQKAALRCPPTMVLGRRKGAGAQEKGQPLRLLLLLLLLLRGAGAAEVLAAAAGRAGRPLSLAPSQLLCAALAHVLLTEQNPNCSRLGPSRHGGSANPPAACSGGIIKPANREEDKGMSLGRDGRGCGEAAGAQGRRRGDGASLSQLRSTAAAEAWAGERGWRRPGRSVPFRSFLGTGDLLRLID